MSNPRTHFYTSFDPNRNPVERKEIREELGERNRK